jgi:hypothetical protein
MLRASPPDLPDIVSMTLVLETFSMPCRLSQLYREKTDDKGKLVLALYWSETEDAPGPSSPAASHPRPERRNLSENFGKKKATPSSSSTPTPTPTPSRDARDSSEDPIISPMDGPM